MKARRSFSANRREHLLELVDGDDQALAVRHAAQRLGEIAAERASELRVGRSPGRRYDLLPAVERGQQARAQQ